MKIIIHDYAGHAFPISLSRALAARGHHVVHAFASCLQTPRGELSRTEDDSELLEFCEIEMDADYVKSKYHFRRRRGMEIAYGRKVAALIKTWQPEVVLSGNTPTETQQSIVKACLACNARFYYWVQDFYSLAVDQILRKKIPIIGAWIGAWYRRLDRWQFQQSSGIITITEDFKPILTKSFGIQAEKISVIPNWANIEKIPVLPKDNHWAIAHGLNDSFVFLYSGTLGMKHNPGMLLDLAKTYAHDQKVVVLVISEGLGADWLRREAQEAGLSQLRVMPYQPFADLPSVLATGDVLMAILEKEAGTFSVPSKTLSYLCAKRALLLAIPSDNLAAKITRDHGAGLTVEPDDCSGWIEAARQLYQDDELRQKLAHNARNYAEKTFPIDQTAYQFEQILSAKI